jgi:hypothetical protein
MTEEVERKANIPPGTVLDLRSKADVLMAIAMIPTDGFGRARVGSIEAPDGVYLVGLLIDDYVLAMLAEQARKLFAKHPLNARESTVVDAILAEVEAKNSSNGIMQ